MLIGGDDISYDVIALGMCFSTFVYYCPYFHFALISRNLTAQSKLKFQRRSCKLSFLFQPYCQCPLDCLLAGYLSFKSEDEIL